MKLDALLLLALPMAAAAQQLPPEAPRYTAVFRGRVHQEGPPLVTPGDHAWEGAKVGAVFLGIGGIGLGYGLCAEGDNGHPTSLGYCAPRALIGGLIMASIGAGLGALIGSAFPKT